MFRKLGLAILFFCSNAFAANTTCVTEVRNYCNDFEPCIRNVDKEKSTHLVKISSNKLTIVKKIGGGETSNWEAKLVNTWENGSRSYLESGGANTLFTLNPSQSRFVLLSPGADNNSTWAQVEIGACK